MKHPSTNQGMTLIECMFAMCILAIAMSFLLHSYVCSIAIDKQTQEIQISYRAAHSTMEALQACSTEDIISGGYLSGPRYFDVKGIAGVSPSNRGKIEVVNITNTLDTGYSSGAYLKIIITVEINGIRRARLVGYKWDGGGKVNPSN